MLRFLFAYGLGIVSYYCYEHYTAKDVKQARNKAEKTWKDTAPLRDKAGRAAGAAFEEFKK